MLTRVKVGTLAQYICEIRRYSISLEQQQCIQQLNQKQPKKPRVRAFTRAGMIFRDVLFCVCVYLFFCLCFICQTSVRALKTKVRAQREEDGIDVDDIPEDESDEDEDLVCGGAEPGDNIDENFPMTDELREHMDNPDTRDLPYCYCHKPWRGGNMIECDVCGQWYHGFCVWQDEYVNIPKMTANAFSKCS